MLGPAPLISLLDRHLADQPACRAALARHAGKQLRLRLPLFSLSLAIADGGGLIPAAAGAAMTTEISAGPDALLAFALGDAGAQRALTVTGDGALAADLSVALGRFDWVLALRPYLGEVAAARAGQALAGLIDWHARARQSLGRTAAEYATYEAGLLADPQALRRFVTEVDTVRDDCARLSARIALLERRRP